MSGVFGANKSGLKLLKTIVASTDATIDFDNLDDYPQFDEFVVKYSQVKPVSNAVQFGFRITEDNGATWNNGSNSYSSTTLRIVGNSSGINGGLYTYGLLTGAGLVSNVANRSMVGRVALFDPTDTVMKKPFETNAVYEYTGGDVIREAGATEYIGTVGAYNGIQFLFTAGNILSGTFRLYGVIK